MTVKDNINKFYLFNGESYTLISISLCKFLYGFYTSAIGSLLVPIGAQFNISFKIQSIIFPFNYFGQIVIIFFAGYFADKLGKKFVHILMLVLLGIFAFIFNFADNFYLMLVLFFLLGLFGISINLIADAAVSDTFKNKKGFYLNIAHVFFGLGALTSPIVFNIIYGLTKNYTALFLILFILSVVIFIMIIFAKYPQVKDEKIMPSAITMLLKNKQFILICIFALLSAGSMHSISSWIPTLFQKNLNASSQIANYSLSFFWASVVAGRIATAFLSRKFDEYFLLKIMNALLFFVLAISYFLNNFILLIIDYIAYGFLIGGTFPLLVAFSAAISPKYSTTRLSMLFSFTAVGMLAVPAIVGVLAEYFLIYKVMAFTSIFFLIFIFIFNSKIKNPAHNLSNG